MSVVFKLGTGTFGNFFAHSIERLRRRLANSSGRMWVTLSRSLSLDTAPPSSLLAGLTSRRTYGTGFVCTNIQNALALSTPYVCLFSFTVGVTFAVVRCLARSLCLALRNTRTDQAMRERHTAVVSEPPTLVTCIVRSRASLDDALSRFGEEELEETNQERVERRRPGDVSARDRGCD